MVHIHGGSLSFASSSNGKGGVGEGSGDEGDVGKHLPLVDCPKCLVRVVKLQSKTIDNPGKWLYKCPNHNRDNSQCPERFFKWEDVYEDYLKANAGGGNISSPPRLPVFLQMDSSLASAGAMSATPPASQPPGSPMRPSPLRESRSPGGAFQPSPVGGSGWPMQPSLLGESWSPGGAFQPSPVGDIRQGRSFQPRSSPEEGSSPATFQPRPLTSSSQTTFRSGPPPVRYRHHPLDYEPAMSCCCKPSQKAGLFISWNKYPGRRYYCCMRDLSDPERCSNFLGWADPAFPQYITNLLGDLRDKVDELTLKNDAHKKKEKELQGSVDGMMKHLNLN